MNPQEVSDDSDDIDPALEELLGLRSEVLNAQLEQLFHDILNRYNQRKSNT